LPLLIIAAYATDRDAGKSKVVYHGIEWSRIMRHIWKRGVAEMSFVCIISLAAASNAGSAA